MFWFLQYNLLPFLKHVSDMSCLGMVINFLSNKKFQNHERTQTCQILVKNCNLRNLWNVTCLYVCFLHIFPFKYFQLIFFRVKSRSLKEDFLPKADGSKSLSHSCSGRWEWSIFFWFKSKLNSWVHGLHNWPSLMKKWNWWCLVIYFCPPW